MSVEEWDVQADTKGVMLLLDGNMFTLTPVEAIVIGDLLVTIGSTMEEEEHLSHEADNPQGVWCCPEHRDEHYGRQGDSDSSSIEGNKG